MIWIGDGKNMENRMSVLVGLLIIYRTLSSWNKNLWIKE